VSSLVTRSALAAALIVHASASFAESAAQLDDALRQYRLAQRLGADGSPDAPKAYEKVVALAPQGPLADDALVDLARLLGSPEWPEDLGAVTAATAVSARAPLEKAVASYSEGDRVFEARYRLALLRAAPLPGRDAAASRQELIALAGSSSKDRWGVMGRYALGILDEQSGARDRAAGAFARIVVERPESDVARRARAGLARTLLFAERFGEAAGWYQDAVETGVAPSLGAAAQRELALRELTRARDFASRWTAVAAPLPVTPTTKGATLLATAGDGRIVVFDRKAGLVQSFDAGGRGTKLGEAVDVSAMATDPYGRVFVATKDRLMRWDLSGRATSSSLGSFTSPAAIAVDAAGVVWLADRKGERIARWIDGTPAPLVIRESKGAGITALVVSGGRAIAAEEKTGRLIAVGEDGAESAFGATTFRRPAALAVDAAGRVSVLDEKAGTVTRLSPAGEVRETLGLEAAGVARALALAAGPDGSVRILDGATGSVAVVP
jgi:hypothetical protein